MTGWDWLGLLGVLMVGGTLAIAILAVTYAIFDDIRGILEARARLRRPTPAAQGVDPDDVESTLHAVLDPHRRRGELRVIPGGQDLGGAA